MATSCLQNKQFSFLVAAGTNPIETRNLPAIFAEQLDQPCVAPASKGLPHVKVCNSSCLAKPSVEEKLASQKTSQPPPLPRQATRALQLASTGSEKEDADFWQGLGLDE